MNAPGYVPHTVWAPMRQWSKNKRLSRLRVVAFLRDSPWATGQDIVAFCGGASENHDRTLMAMVDRGCIIRRQSSHGEYEYGLTEQMQ